MGKGLALIALGKIHPSRLGTDGESGVLIGSSLQAQKYQRPSSGESASVIMTAVGLKDMKLKYLVLFLALLIACGRLDAASPKVILVFPLENLSGNNSLGWMSEGIAELLATRLASPTRYILQRSERDAAYEQLGLPLETPLTLASEYKVAQVLGASTALVGNFTLVGDQLTTRVQWLDVARLNLSHPIEVSGKLMELDKLETRLAWQLLKSQDPEAVMGTEEEFRNRFPTVRLDAFESYIRGILSTDSNSRIHFLRESDRLNPGDHRAAFALGKYYFDQESYADSARWLQILNSGDRSYAESQFLLGIDEYFLGHNTSAESAFQKLIAMVPLGEAYNNLGAVEMRLGHYNQGLADFRKAFEKEQGETDYAFNMSLALWHLKKYSQVATYLREVLAQNPDDLDAHVLMAEVSGELGDTGSRRTELEWVSAHEKSDTADPPGEDNGVTTPPDPSPRIMKDYDGKAFRLLLLAMIRATDSRLSQEPASVEENDGQAHLKQGLDMLSAGRLPEAEQELTQAVLLLPGSSEAHQALGQTYEMEGKHTLAATELDTSLKEKDTPQAHFWLARAYLSLEHLAPALKQAQVALRLNPASAEAKGLVAQIQTQLSVHRDKP
jgi:tetratricopeptide (TPR) repeat protein